VIPRGDDPLISEGGRPPCHPPPVLVSSGRVVGRGCEIPSRYSRSPRSLRFDAQGGRPPFDPPPVMPSGDDPPSTPRRSCPGGRPPFDVARSSRDWPGVRKYSRSLVPRSGRSAFCVLRSADSQGGTTPLRPPAGHAQGVLGRGVQTPAYSGSGRSAFCVPRLFDPPPVMPRGDDPPSTPRRYCG
jgi:hypothetical protein